MSIELKPYIVAFIDLLGFSAMVSHDCETPNGDQKYVESLHEVYTDTKKISNKLKDLQLMQFSDSITLAVPYSKENATSLINIVSDYQYNLLKKGVLCRGGISYGKHYSAEGFVFSKALIDAYEIESRFASAPRIVVSQNLLDLVAPLKTENPIPEVLLENDGLSFVHYLKDKDPSESWNAVEAIAPTGLHEKPSIRKKQIWLHQYYNATYPDQIKKDYPRFSIT